MAAMEGGGGHKLAVIRADGGLTVNEFVRHFLADMLERPVEIPHVTETTAWGAACLAGPQAGVFDGLEDIARTWEAARRYEPSMAPERRQELYAGWKNAVKMLL